jgi:hypothetical protein
MSTTTVKTVGGLMSALRIAKSGDTIQLASGTYAGLDLQHANFGAAVTITSADPENPAILRKLEIADSSNITIKSLNIQGKGNNVWYYANIAGSRNITLSDVNISGTDPSPSGDAGGLNVTGSTSVTVTHSRFSNVETGISESGNAHLAISANDFRNIGSDGIDSAGSSYLAITDNFFTGFHPTAGQHPDAIQFWTENTATSARDIQIAGNTIERGSGAAIQGIFVQDDSGRLPYLGLSITGNRVIGEGYNGIAIQGSRGAIVSGNVVQPYAGQESWIEVEGSAAARLTGNSAGSYVLAHNSGTMATGDRTLAPVRPGIPESPAATALTPSPALAAAPSLPQMNAGVLHALTSALAAFGVPPAAAARTSPATAQYHVGGLASPIA